MSQTRELAAQNESKLFNYSSFFIESTDSTISAAKHAQIKTKNSHK